MKPSIVFGLFVSVIGGGDLAIGPQLFLDPGYHLTLPVSHESSILEGPLNPQLDGTNLLVTRLPIEPDPEIAPLWDFVLQVLDHPQLVALIARDEDPVPAHLAI